MMRSLVVVEGEGEEEAAAPKEEAAIAAEAAAAEARIPSMVSGGLESSHSSGNW